MLQMYYFCNVRTILMPSKNVKGKKQLKIVQEAKDKNIAVFNLSIILRDKTRHLISKLADGNGKTDLS